MKLLTQACLWLVVALIAALPVGSPAQTPKPDAWFPELAGWQKKGSPETFSSENLYEHINGAAENFLGYDFRELAVQNYQNDKKQTISAEVYFHGNLENAFGIYSSEKPLAGDYLPIGAQGYYEEGVLNFISGACYVKLNGFDLGPNGRQALLDLAGRIAVAIGGRNHMPEILAAFPALGKIPNSERFILRNFLGHPFLQSAYTAEYDRLGEKFQLFIMRAADENGAQALLRQYFALNRDNPAPIIAPGALAFRDPYNGPVRLFWQGRYICGSLSQHEDIPACLKEICRNLAE